MSSSKDETIRVWDLVANESLTELTGQGKVLSLAVLNNGYLATSSMDKTIKIWNANLFYNVSKIF